MELPMYKANVDVTEHHLMGLTVQTVNANMGHVLLIQLHLLVIVTMDVDVQHRANVLGFYVIYAIR